MSEEAKPFQIPDKFLAQLDEFTGGAFILISLGSNGSPEVHAKFDNLINALGLIKYAKIWSETIDSAQENGISNSLTGTEEEEDD